MKIISPKYWQDMKNFVEQISKKFGGFYIIKTNLVQTCCRKAHQNIGENSYIVRYSKRQISDDKIGRPIYRSSLYHT